MTSFDEAQRYLMRTYYVAIRNGKTEMETQPAKEEETKTVSSPNFSSGNIVVTPYHSNIKRMTWFSY